MYVARLDEVPQSYLSQKVFHSLSLTPQFKFHSIYSIFSFYIFSLSQFSSSSPTNFLSILHKHNFCARLHLIELSSWRESLRQRFKSSKRRAKNSVFTKHSYFLSCKPSPSTLHLMKSPPTQNSLHLQIPLEFSLTILFTQCTPRFPFPPLSFIEFKTSDLIPPIEPLTFVYIYTRPCVVIPLLIAE